MDRITISAFSQEELIEFTYIAGLHKRARILANALGLDDLLIDLQEKYQYNDSIKDNFSSEEDKELERVRSLCSLDALKFLRDLASVLPAGSNILEVGTYIGGTSIALLQGAKYSHCKYTAIDVYAGFTDVKNKTNSFAQCMHWEHLEWQNNISKYSELVTSYHGCSIPVLRNLVKEQKKYDLIFIDTAHELDSLAEFTLITCLANDNCLFVFDDVIDFNREMTSAWLVSLKYNFAFPKFFRSKYALARPKNAHMPLNFKNNIPSMLEEVLKLTDFINSKTVEGCKFTTTKISEGHAGFSLNIL